MWDDGSLLFFLPCTGVSEGPCTLINQCLIKVLVSCHIVLAISPHHRAAPLLRVTSRHLESLLSTISPSPTRHLDPCCWELPSLLLSPSRHSQSCPYPGDFREPEICKIGSRLLWPAASSSLGMCFLSKSASSFFPQFFLGNWPISLPEMATPN